MEILFCALFFFIFIRDGNDTTFQFHYIIPTLIARQCNYRKMNYLAFSFGSVVYYNILYYIHYMVGLAAKAVINISTSLFLFISLCELCELRNKLNVWWDFLIQAHALIVGTALL